ncbi:hypothetical protein [Iningainema tapete]|uniref:Uncharacterized protein n=1 Tax=Iningainema tapete BLCC-T55 TaxID=2748662 RepID=A0A8J6XFV7_9CYAN|nr:hypothetical protein [Iningainema tapete]MBD2771777.1 hypothetical protein [Iningainema tapete BLCC-T55]
MNKHFGLVLLLLFAIVGSFSTRANAGSTGAVGTSVESSSFSGDNFSPQNQSVPTQVVPGTNLSIDFNGQIKTPAVIQEQVNQVASKIYDQSSDCSGRIVAMLARCSTVDVFVNEFQAFLSSTGVSQSLTTPLVKNIVGLFEGFATAQPKAGNVNINQLNAAIKAYNRIVRKSDTKTLQELYKNSEFIELGKVLKELRAAVNVR